MTDRGMDERDALAERQTKALEDIRGAVLFLLALAILGSVLGLVVLVRG